MLCTIDKYIERLFSYNVVKYKKPQQTSTGKSHIVQMFTPDVISP